MGISSTLKNTLCVMIKNPKREISYAWLFSLVLVFTAFIVACVAASKMSADASDQAAAFSAVWTAILLVVISIAGTVIMRRYQTPLAIGFLLGLIFILTQQMLIIFAIFVEESQESGNSLSQTQSQQAMAVFSFFLFIVYSLFGSLLAIFRHDIIRPDDSQSSYDPNAFAQPEDIPDDEAQY